MTTLADLIVRQWEENAAGYAQMLVPLNEAGYPAWTINLSLEGFAVAIPCEKGLEVAESFASVSLSTFQIKNIPTENALVLSSPEPSEAFAAVCSEFVAPGSGGVARAAIAEKPVAWWQEWKRLLGNKSIDKMIYDVLGEMICLEILSKCGLEPKWGGSSQSTVDIDCGEDLYEVKSTLTRNSTQVQVHGLYQLASKGRKRYLLVVRMEPAISGISIDDMVRRLNNLGYSNAELNNALLDLGYPRGGSARKQRYKVLDVMKYCCDSDFPHIDRSSFVEGCLPLGVTAISYTISLDGFEGESLLDFNSDDWAVA